MSNAKRASRLIRDRAGDLIDPGINPLDMATFPRGHVLMMQPELSEDREIPLAHARKRTHDALMAAARPARRSPIAWTRHEHDLALVQLAQLRTTGTADWSHLEEQLRADASLVMVMAWCVIDSRVATAPMN